MYAFVQPSTSTCFVQKTGSQFVGCPVRFKVSDLTSPTRVNQTSRIVCEESFNYNIYQDVQDRSEQTVSDKDRPVVLQN